MYFVGNKQSVIEIINWLNEFFHGTVSTICPHCSFPINTELQENILCSKCKKDFQYERCSFAIVYGGTGNGKSYLFEELTKEYNVELFRITSLDIEEGKDIINIIKTMNAMTLEGKKNKLVVIDDIDEYKLNIAKKLYDLITETKQPIVFIRGTYPTKEERNNYGKPLIVEIKKPSVSELKSHLRTVSNLSEDLLERIARESPSFRSAVLSANSSLVNDLIVSYKSGYQQLKELKARKFEEPLTRENVKWLFNSIRGVEEEPYKLMEHIAEFDYLIRSKFMEIDPFVLNNLPVDFKKVNFEQRFRNSENGKKKPKKLKKIVVKEKKEKNQKTEIIKKQVGLDNWF